MLHWIVQHSGDIAVGIMASVPLGIAVAIIVFACRAK
jgi:hypothetical protein